MAINFNGTSVTGATHDVNFNGCAVCTVAEKPNNRIVYDKQWFTISNRAFGASSQERHLYTTWIFNYEVYSAYYWCVGICDWQTRGNIKTNWLHNYPADFNGALCMRFLVCRQSHWSVNAYINTQVVSNCLLGTATVGYDDQYWSNWKPVDYNTGNFDFEVPGLILCSERQQKNAILGWVGTGSQVDCGYTTINEGWSTWTILCAQFSRSGTVQTIPVSNTTLTFNTNY